MTISNCVFLIDNRYRAEIVAIQPNSNDLVLDVYFLDYGDQQFVGRKEILELRADFLSLRFQAVECFLAHVQPLNTGSKFEEWDRRAIERFESLVQVAQEKKMISKVVTYKERKSFVLQRPSNKRESSPIPGVELYEENLERNIALELVQSGYAEMSDRFGDLAKSSVLAVDEKNEQSKEVTPEPKDVLNESVESNSEQTEGSGISPQISSESNKSDSNDQPAESTEKKLPEVAQKSEGEPEKVPIDNNNDENFNPQSITNGKSQKPKREPATSSNMFSGNKPPKSKKKKQDATADFLRGEQQQNASKKYKSEDWNAMMEE